MTVVGVGVSGRLSQGTYFERGWRDCIASCNWLRLVVLLWTLELTKLLLEIILETSEKNNQSCSPLRRFAATTIMTSLGLFVLLCFSC